MSDSIRLAATVRNGKVSDLKEMIPAVMYGSGSENVSLSIKRVEFEKVFAQSGESGLISLKLDDGAESPVIVKDYQLEAVKHRIIHVDFFKVNMKEKVTAEVSLEFVGESPAVKTKGGIVIHNFDTLEIECLPSDLVQKVEVNLGMLENLGDSITIADITLPKGVIFTHEPSDDVVVHVIEPKKSVEDAAADAAIEATAEANAAGTAAGTAAPKAEEKK